MRVATCPTGIGEPERWIRAFAGLYLEVEAGLRPARHIRPLLATELQLRLGGCGRAGPVPEIHRVVVQHRDRVCEAVVLLRRGDRTSALVLALRRHAEGWRIVEVCRPESPPPPPAAAGQLALTQTTWHDRPVQPAPTPDWRLPAGWATPSRAA